jgi:Na+/H+ antiporter NhaD/arsenite permease-like protein
MTWEQFFSNDVLWIILALIVLVGVVYLYNKDRDKNSDIDFTDLITVNGKLNDRKLARFGAWIVSTWGFVYLISHDKLSEWYFIGYMGAWVANALIGKMIKDPRDEDNYRNTNKPIKKSKEEPAEDFERQL